MTPRTGGPKRERLPGAVPKRWLTERVGAHLLRGSVIRRVGAFIPQAKRRHHRQPVIANLKNISYVSKQSGNI